MSFFHHASNIDITPIFQDLPSEEKGPHPTSTREKLSRYSKAKVSPETSKETYQVDKLKELASVLGGIETSGTKPYLAREILKVWDRIENE